MTPVVAARAFKAGDAAALRFIPLAAAPNRASLAEMDGLPIVPSRRWCGYYTGVWIEAGLLRYDVDASRFVLTATGRENCL